MTNDELMKLLQKKSAEIDSTNNMDEKVLKSLFENRLMSILAPKDFGGEDSYMSAVMHAESLSKVNAGVAHSVVVHNMVVDAFRLFANSEQKDRWLKDICNRKVATLAITEPGGGSDVSSLKMTAEREGDTYILNGRKTLITNAEFAKVFLVLAKTGDRFSAFITGRDGVTVRKLNPSGMRGSGLSSVSFENVEVEEVDVLGGVGNGLRVALGTLAPNRIPFSAMGLGIAKRCLDLAVKYAKERDAFGRKVADFQGIQWMLAEMATDIEFLDRMVKYSALVADGKESSNIDVTTLGAMCKLKSAEIAKKSADIAVEIFGGHGIISGSPVERARRDAKLIDIAEGTSEIMKVIISRALLK